VNGTDTVCDGVKIGRIVSDQNGIFIGYYLDGTEVKRHPSRPYVYKALRDRALKDGLLKRVRKGAYRAADAS